MYDIEYDPSADLLKISVKGFWAPEDVGGFAEAMHSAARSAHEASERFNVLVESLEFPVQGDAVADLLAGTVPGNMALTSGRVAVLVGSQLNKLQAERTLLHPRVRVFLSWEGAEAWLNGGDTA